MYLSLSNFFPFYLYVIPYLPIYWCIFCYEVIDRMYLPHPTEYDGPFITHISPPITYYVLSPYQGINPFLFFHFPTFLWFFFLEIRESAHRLLEWSIEGIGERDVIVVSREALLLGLLSTNSFSDIAKSRWRGKDWYLDRVRGHSKWSVG